MTWSQVSSGGRASSAFLGAKRRASSPRKPKRPGFLVAALSTGLSRRPSASQAGKGGGGQAGFGNSGGHAKGSVGVWADAAHMARPAFIEQPPYQAGAGTAQALSPCAGTAGVNTQHRRRAGQAHVVHPAIHARATVFVGFQTINRRACESHRQPTLSREISHLARRHAHGTAIAMDRGREPHVTPRGTFKRRPIQAPKAALRTRRTAFPLV
jgi:hypothetical protein